MTKKSNTLQKIKSKIINLCIKDEKCIQQILQKLRNCGCNEIDSMKIIKELIQQDYINEERYSKSFFSGKFKMKRWGKRKIIFELKKRKISKKNINKGLAEISDKEYLDTIKFLIKKKNSLIRNDLGNLERKRKILAFMSQKGYEYNLVYKNLDNL